MNSLIIYKDGYLKIYRVVADFITFQKCIFNYFSIQVTVEVLRGEHKKITVTLEPNLDESESNDMPNPRTFKVSAYKMNMSFFVY